MADHDLPEDLDDTYGDIGAYDDDGQGLAAAAGELRAVTGGARLLKITAAGATGLWLLSVITVFWNWWDALGPSSNSGSFNITTGSPDNHRLLQALASTLQATWGYLLVAVIAYIGSLILQGQRVRLVALSARSGPEPSAS